jgi:hypothetical protein
LVSIAYVALQIVIIYKIAKWVFNRFVRGNFHLVDGKVVRAPNEKAAQQLSRLEHTVRNIVRATFGASPHFDRVRFGVGDKSNAGVTKGKSRIELCLTGDDDEDALMVVALHEASHALNKTIGHDASFRTIQRKLIDAAKDLGFIQRFDEPRSVCNKRVSWPK